MPAPTKPAGKIVAAIGATKQSARCQIDAVGPTDCLAVPAPGEVLTWDGTQWIPAPAPGAGSVTDVTASSPLSSSGGATPNISIDPGGPAGEVLTWNGAAWVSAAPVDTGITQLTQDVIAGPGSGSQIATVVGLQTRPVSNAAPNVGDVLTWDGTQWVPMSTFTSANFDAFGRLRASAPQTIFDSKLVYDAQPLYWDESQTPVGPGAPPAGAWLASDARVRLTVNGVNQTSIRQTRRYFTYQPGKSQLIFVTYNLNGAVAEVTKRVGYFDSDNGILLELTGAGASLVRRSGSSTASDSVAQASWNLDPMDGSGPSGVDLQFDKTAILIIDFEWLGVGSIRVGFVVNGQIYYAHRFDNANLNAAVYMSTPNLPVRYEISTTGAFAGSTYMDCICSSVSSEGGLQATGTKFGFAIPARVTGVGNGARTTLLSLRHNGTYPRVTIIPTSVGPLADSNGTSKWELVYNPSFTVAPTWAAATRGYCDLDIVGTVTAGTGTVISAGVFSNSTAASNLDLFNTTLTLGADIAGNSDVMSLVITNLSGGNANYLAAIDWIAVT